MPSIKIEGLKELSRDLKKLDKELPKELKKVSKDAADIVAQEARGIVPVRTGKLRNKIKAGATQAGGDVRVTGLVYAKCIHFGWPKHSIAPNQFLFKALDARRDDVIERFNDNVAKLIDSTIAGG